MCRPSYQTGKASPGELAIFIRYLLPVSYTHLDVYKRQRYSRLICCMAARYSFSPCKISLVLTSRVVLISDGLPFVCQTVSGKHCILLLSPSAWLLSCSAPFPMTAQGNRAGSVPSRFFLKFFQNFVHLVISVRRFMDTVDHSCHHKRYGLCNLMGSKFAPNLFRC